MNLLSQIWRSSLGKKYVMAVSGCVLVFFVIGHMIGNLQIFLAPEAINRYAHFLKSVPELLWAVRIGMLVMVALHIISAVRLRLENSAARPVGYAGNPAPKAASYASRSMLMTGLIIGTFIVYHLLHYTVLVTAVNFTGVDFATLKDPHTGGPDVYAMVIYGFNQWFVSLFYLLAVGLLCLHLSHGIGAMFQSIGWKNAAWAPIVDKAAKGIAIVLFVGYCSIPVAVLCGHGKDHVNKIIPKAPMGQEAVK